MHLHPASVVFNESKLAESIHEEIDAGAHIPAVSASDSWLIFGMTTSGLPSLPK